MLEREMVGRWCRFQVQRACTLSRGHLLAIITTSGPLLHHPSINCITWESSLVERSEESAMLEREDTARWCRFRGAEAVDLEWRSFACNHHDQRPSPPPSIYQLHHVGEFPG